MKILVEIFELRCKMCDKVLGYSIASQASKYEKYCVSCVIKNRKTGLIHRGVMKNSKRREK